MKLSWQITVGGPGESHPVPDVVGPIPVDGSAVESVEPAEYPSMLRQGLNFGKAILKFTLAGAPTRTPDEINELAAICRACPTGRFDPSEESCTRCGCPVTGPGSLRNKLALKTERCPDGHW